MSQLYDRHFPANWIQRMGEPEVWQYIHKVDPGELWETHNTLKNLLLSFVRRRFSRQCRRRGESDDVVEGARNVLDSNALTIGFGRRFATYKRADLIMSDPDRLLRLLEDTERPIQLIFAGKAHPKDEPGKKLIQTVANARHDDRYRGRIVFVEDYDINVCRHLIQGVDVWLNNPRSPFRGLRDQRSEGRAQWWSQSLRLGRLVGRGLRRRVTVLRSGTAPAMFPMR